MVYESRVAREYVLIGWFSTYLDELRTARQMVIIIYIGGEFL